MTDHRQQEPQDNAIDSSPVSNTEPDEILPGAVRKKRRIGPWLFLLLIFIGMPAAWLLAPPEIRQQAMSLLNRTESQSQVPQAVPPLTAAMPQDLPGTENTAPVPEAATLSNEADIPEPPEAGTAPEASGPAQAVDTSANQQDEIARLQDELSRMRSAQKQLTQQLKSPPQTIELHAWLSLLASPDTHLGQRAGMWAYLATRPALDTAWKEKAAGMAALLDRDREQLDDLRKALKQLAHGIPESRQPDIIPKPENPYFAWLAGTFHLRHAPDSVERQQTDLRRQLLDMEHALSLEDWPEPRAWRQLLGTVIDQLGDVLKSGLPEAPGDIRLDIEASRKAASDWMEAL